MQKTKRILALLLVAALTVTQLPVMALATSLGEGSEIIAFDTLPEETANQTAALGASLEDLDLPNTLNAIVHVAAVANTEAPEPDNETVLDSGEPQQEEPSEPVADANNEGKGKLEPDKGQTEPEADKPEQAHARPETMEMSIPIPVKWISSPDYDGEKADTYIFTAQIEGFAVSAAPPSITVTVGEIAGTVTAFEELLDEIRWQNTAEPTFPETVSGTVEGEAAQIPVTWQTEQDYDKNAPERGLYVFDAVPGEGYTLAEGVEALRITVFIPETANRFAPFRMGGGGTDARPLEITTADQLAEIAVLVNAGRLESFLLNGIGNVSLKLMNDLDLSGHGQSYNGGKGWVPIGTADKPFKGNFDGGGKVITGLYISCPDMDYLGLFGYVNGGRVQYLGLKDVHIVGWQRVGGVAGYVRYNGTVQDCYVIGSISGTYTVGGVVGGANTSSTVQDCYATVSVSGTSYVGGVVGDVANGSTVQNCYATGSVSGIGAVGGVTGRVFDGGEVTSCAALNIAVCGSNYVGRVAGSAYGEITLSGNAAFGGMTVTVEDSPKAITSDAAGVDGADIAATAIKADGTIGGCFTEDNGWTVANGSLPGFGAVVAMPDYITGGTDLNFLGAGTAANPFLIDTAEKLAKLAELVNSTDEATHNFYNSKSYKLTNDIDLSAYGKSYDDNKGWNPIGGHRYDADTGIPDVYVFSGSFDGGGHKITGLYINRPEEKHVGLFGYIWCDTGILDIKNLGLEGVSIVGDEYVGGIAGYAKHHMFIKSCYVTGSVSGTGGVGGIVGICDKDVIVQSCYSSGSVSGTVVVGGITGYVYYEGFVFDCYSAASVSGSGNFIGGIAGCLNAGNVIRCYATGSVEGTSGVGGIVGQNSGTLRSSIALNSSVTGQDYVGRVVGDNGDNTEVEGISTGNYAFSGMTDPGAGKFGESSGYSDKNGQDVTADTLQTEGVFQFDLTAAPWTYTPGFLPGLSGKTVEMPAHITNGLTNPFGGGDGTSAETAYQISNAAQLAKLAELVNSDDDSMRIKYSYSHYKLMNDIDLSGYNQNGGWVPIGCISDGYRSFNGTFDGNHKTITGLYINRPNNDLQGLFGVIYDKAVLKNLSIAQAQVTGKNEVAGLVGVSNQGGTIEACYVSGNIRGQEIVGAIVGSSYGCHISNCYSNGSVSGSHIVGGVAGDVYQAMIQNCYSTVSVSGSFYFGGVAGRVSDATVQNCAALNPSAGSTGSDAGRVAGFAVAPDALKNNYAFSGMIGGGSYKTADGTDGADISISQIYNADFWATAANWDALGWNASIWTFENDKLPILAGFAPGVQSGDGGLYLIERDISNATVDTGGPYTYNGSPIETTLIDTFGGEELVEDRDYTVAVTGGTSNGTNAGIVTLKLTGIGNFKGAKTGVTYTIQQKALTADMLADVTGTFTYSGTAHIPVVTVTDGGTALAKNTDYTVDYDGNTNAGTATVTVTGTGNYSGAVSKNFTIEKAIPTALTWPGASAITYGAALVDSSLTGGSATGTWAWTVGTTVPPAGTAGYELTFTPADITNYDWSGVSLRQNVSLTVNKASGLTVSTQPSMNARGSVTRSYELDMDNIALNKADTGAKTYSAVKGTDVSGILSNVQVNGNKLTYSIADTAAVGNTATVAITISTANYEDATATLTITVTPKDTPTIGFEDSTVTKTYGDAKFTQTAALQGIGGTGQITYASDNTAVATMDTATGEVTIVGAGNANITATKAADDDWYAATAVYVLTVNKKTATITAHDKTAKARQSEPEYTYTVTGLISGESLTIEPTVTCPTVNMNVSGTYAIVPSGVASANYAIQYQNGTLTVIPLSTACDVVSVIYPSSTAINGTSIAATVANSVISQLVGVTVSTDAAWALYRDMACTSEITNKTMTLSVGTNTAYIKVTAEDGITAKIYTVTITRSSSSGGGDSGGGSGGSSSGGTSGDTTTTTPGKTPEQPITAATSITATAGAGGSASASIPDKAITDTIAKARADAKAQTGGDADELGANIAKARADAKAQGKTANGISVALNVTMPKGSTSLTATLTRNSLNSLVSAGVSQFELGGAPISLSLDLKALQEIQKQSDGDISITIAPATGLSKEAKALLGNRPVYSITISYVKGGKTVNVTSLGSGTATLSIPYTPGKNEAVGYLFGVFVDANGKAQRIPGSAYDANSRGLLIPTDHFSVYGVGYTAPIAKFTDIGNHWGKEAIDYVVGRGLLSGTSETTFAPNTAMTRGMLVTALGRLAGVDTKAYTTNSFTDVKADSVFRPYIEWAYKKGVVQGIDNQQFAPDRAITREEITVIFANFAKVTSYKLPITREATTFADASSIGSAYKTAVTAMQQAGIMMGEQNNCFNPTGKTTRAEVSSMLHRYIKLTIDPATAQGWTLNDAGQWLYYKDGKPLAGWQTIDGQKYYFYSTGILQTGWVKDGNNWRYYSGNKALTGWWDIGSETGMERYYFDTNAVMISGKWLQINGKWYYFYADGALAVDTKIDGYEVDGNGMRIMK